MRLPTRLSGLLLSVDRDYCDSGAGEVAEQGL